MEISQIHSVVNAMKQTYHKDLGILQQLQNAKEEKTSQIESKLKEKEELELKKVLVKEASIEARNQAKDVLQDMGSRALQFIMGDHMSLNIDLKEQAKQWVAQFMVKAEYTDDYVVETDPAEEDGGGVADIVSMSSQASMLQLIGKNNVAPFFMDEPSKFVSAGHAEPVAKFLQEYSSYYKRQGFMVTHDQYLANIGDVAYHFEKDDEGKTVVTRLTA